MKPLLDLVDDSESNYDVCRLLEHLFNNLKGRF